MDVEKNKKGVSAVLGSKKLLTFLAFSAITLAVMCGALTYSSASCAGNRFDHNDRSEYQGADNNFEDTGRHQEKRCDFKINWNPTQADITLGPGETKTVQATATITGSHPDLTAEVVPELKPYLSVSPTSIPASKKSQAVSFNLTTTIPADALPTTLDGTVHLRYGKATSSKPLAIELRVIWNSFNDASTGSGLVYTSFGSIGNVEADPVDYGNGNTGNTYRVEFPTASSVTAAVQYLVTVLNNPLHQSLLEWFASNVDSSMILINSGTFTQTLIANGTNALILSGPVPESYDDGPVSDVFALSPSGNSIITITTSNGNTMRHDLGLSRESIMNTYLQILSSSQFP